MLVQVSAKNRPNISCESVERSHFKTDNKSLIRKIMIFCNFCLNPHLNASNIGRRLRSAVSLGSLNHDFIGIALSVRTKRNHLWYKTALSNLCYQYHYSSDIKVVANSDYVKLL